MTVLGEAFIEVKGDLKPFIRDLDKEVKRAAQAMERQFKAAIGNVLGDSGADGEKLGDKLGDGIKRRIKDQLGDKKKPPWINISAALASALDDGISALPAEAKAGIVLGILAAVPLISAAISGAVAAGLGLGLAGIGIMVASQFQEVEDEAKQTGDVIRNAMTRVAEPFGLETVRALELVQDAFARIETQLTGIFATAATFVEPLTRGVLNLLGNIIDSIDAIDDQLGPFVDELAFGFGTIGAAIGEAFEILVNTGEEGQEGLRDMIFLLADLIVFVANTVAVFTELYGIIRDIIKSVPFLTPFLAMFVDDSDAAADATNQLGQASNYYTEEVDAAVKATKAQEKALKDAAKAMDATRDAEFGLIDATIAYEQSLDDLRDTLSENGKTLAFETDAGRENLRALGDAIKDAQKVAEDRFNQGKLNAEQARALYDAEIAQILKVARSHGVTEEAIRKVYGEAIKLVNLPDANTGWLTKLSGAAATAAAQLERAQRAAGTLSRLPAASNRGFQEFAEGGIVHHPTQALIGEAGSEVVIPLTRPARAAELMRMSGLDRMLQPATPTVQVFVGNEQLDARTYRIVTDNNAALSSSLAFGARGL